MKNKEKDFRNMVDDPYLYKNCCGGVTMGADGSQDLVGDADLGGKAKKLLTGVVVLVGVVVTSTWAYNRFLKK